MAKTITRSTSGRGQLVGEKGRDSGFPRRPIRVTDDAQAGEDDIYYARKSTSGRAHDREVERPKTATGTATQVSIRRKDSRRETKDDLHLNPLALHGTRTTFYDFPLPVKTPPPDPRLPESSLSLSRNSLVLHTTTQEVMEAGSVNTLTPSLAIGMALGSPSHASESWQEQPQVERTLSPDTFNDSAASIASAPTKQKASRWKVLGGLFGGRRNTEGQPQSFYQVQPESSERGATVSTTTGSSYTGFGEPPQTEAPDKKRSRGRSISSRKTKSKDTRPDVKRAHTLPQGLFNYPASGQATPQITLDGNPLNAANQAGQRPLGHTLDVEIPSIQLERYSVMFGNVLQTGNSTNPSLLARRQATLEKLKTVNEDLVLQEAEIKQRERRLLPRRATSPGLTRSPAFSLFPSTPSKISQRELSPSTQPTPTTASRSLYRSNTSPAVLSPSRPVFAPRLDDQAYALLVTEPSSKGLATNTTRVNAIERTQTANMVESRSPSVPPKDAKFLKSPSNWNPEESHLVLSPPRSGDNVTYPPTPTSVHDTQPLKPKLVEPTWEIVNKRAYTRATPTTASSSNLSDHSTLVSMSSTSAASVSTATSASIPFISQQPIKSAVQIKLAPQLQSHSRGKLSNASAMSHASVEDIEERLKSAAEVSIARQISVSQQQRQLLIPINSMKRTPSNSSTRQNHNANFPSPLTQTMNPKIDISRQASPLGAVATAASEEHARPLAARSQSSPLINRPQVVSISKPNTPTLVVVPGAKDCERVKEWDGNTSVTSNRSSQHSIATRRTGHDLGEIKVGLPPRRTVKRSETARENATEKRETQHRQRKSERVVVERISIVSS